MENDIGIHKGKVFKITDKTVIMNVTYENDIKETREFPKTLFAKDVKIDDEFTIKITGGSGWMQVDFEKIDKNKDEPKYITMIDDEYLKAALKEMRANHSMRDSMAILNPNPFSHHDQQELNEAKLNQLELIIKLKENITTINKLSDNLNRAKKHENEMKNIFGG